MKVQIQDPKTREKVVILQSLDTKSLVEKLHKYEDEMEMALREEASFRNLNHEYLASGTGDCQEVKRILAELSARGPESNPEGKKLTIADRENWLVKQRTENKELSGAINRQREVSFLVDNHQIKAEMAKRRLEGIKGILSLKTQQIAFLARD